MASPIKGSFSARLPPAGRLPHTLILGTQPSDSSLKQQQYYAYHTNAFWHIIGDALGWRRGWLDENGRGPPGVITRSLLHERVVDEYDVALEDLTSRGYALWDVLAQSERHGSLDGSIKNEKPADIQGLCRAYPSITKVCFSSGKTTATFFKKYFKPWLAKEGAFYVGTDELSQSVFGSIVPTEQSEGAIELVVMESVSGAYVPGVNTKDVAKRRNAWAKVHARYPELASKAPRASSYAWKRQQWFDACLRSELSAPEAARRFGDRTGDLLEGDSDDDDEQPTARAEGHEQTTVDIGIAIGPTRGSKKRGRPPRRA